MKLSLIFVTLFSLSLLLSFPFFVGVCLFVYNMATAKLDTEMFDGHSNFSRWRRKMKVVLVKNRVVPAILSPEKYPESLKGEILAKKLD